MRNRDVSTSGFTLVELMVVVAIVGVLATVATASYHGYMYRARQTEAKVALSAIYSAEVGFAAENGTYTACVKQAGYSPTQGSTNYFFEGFNKATALLTTCGVNGTSPCNIYSAGGATCLTVDVTVGDPQSTSDIGYAPNGMLQTRSDNPFVNEAQASTPTTATLLPIMLVTLSESHFRAGAAAVDSSGNCIGLTIDSTKTLDYPNCN